MKRISVLLIALLTFACGDDTLVGPTKSTTVATPAVPIPAPNPFPSPLPPVLPWTVALSGPSGYDCPGARLVPQLEKKTFTFTVNINEPMKEPIVIQTFWHYTSHPTCDAINDVAPIGLKIIGPNVFGVDEYGSFDVDLEPFACGAGQLDVIAINQKTRKELPGWRFISGVYNTFKECLAPPEVPPVPPAPPVPPVPPIPPIVPPVPPPPVPPVVPPLPPDDDPPPPPMANCVYGTDAGLSDVHVSDDGTTYSFRVREGYKDVPLRLTSYEGYQGHVPPDRPQKLITQKLETFQPGFHTWSIRKGCQTDMHCTAEKANDILWPGDYDGLYIASAMFSCPVQ